MFASAAGVRPVAAQDRPGLGPAAEGGLVEVGLLLREMEGTGRVLVIGAHPDDEDTALLAELDRRRGVRAAYLSLTRGEGGQNLIGPELGKGLGLIRTGELLAARRLDGAEQRFTRAYDFGYSKTAEETFRHWPRRALLDDVVWTLRTFRPHVVVSVFSGTPADGHGQHEVAGLLAREGFRAAADSSCFPEHLRRGVSPWRTSKLYRRAWRDPERATLRVPTGEYDPLLGRSPFQLAMESRSQHRSQGFGTVRPPGPRYTRLTLVESRVEAPPDAPLFAGIDTTLAGLVAGLPPGTRRNAEAKIDEYRAAVRTARDSLRVLDPGAAVPALAAALRAAREAERAAASAGRAGEEPARVLARKASVASRGLLAAAGTSVRFRAEEARWVPGEPTRVHAEVWNGGSRRLRVGPPELRLPEGWSARLLPADSVHPTPQERSRFYAAGAAAAGGTAGLDLSPGELARWTFELRVPADARPTEPYFLRRDTVGDLYRWPDDPALRGRPLSPPVATGRVPVVLEGEGSAEEERIEAAAEAPVRYRGSDEARGEFWRPVHVVPRVSVAAEPEVLVWPLGGEGAAGRAAGSAGREVTVTARSLASDTLAVEMSLGLPPEWSADADAPRVRLEGRGAAAGRTFALRAVPPSGEAARDSFRTYRLPAVARAADGGRPNPSSRARSWHRELSSVDYPHIEPVPLYRDAEVRVERFPLRVDRGRRVGYVMGSGDRVPEAIRQMGLEVEMLGPERLASGSLEGLDVVVLGVRAYEVREDLQSANSRLLDWARRGGTLIVQYNKYPFVEGGFAPYRATMARPHDRVTDERAPVTMLRPEAPVLSGPNRISERDFGGWIQERGLYFLHEWGEPFTPVLATSDPGEEPKEGGLLVAPLGRGLYVYTGLAFFRQLPEGVPGAYRLFANLLSLEPEEWRAWAKDAGLGGGPGMTGDARGGTEESGDPRGGAGGDR